VNDGTRIFGDDLTEKAGSLRVCADISARDPKEFEVATGEE